MIPILERLLFRPQDAPTSRVLVLTPTRELAVQCHSVAVKLARFTDIQFALLVGGLSNKAQEAVLRRRPDVLIATPGRLIDHLQNAPSFDLNSLEILVMDEADRMLEDGFKEELTEIIRHCPRGRQTMLFSASMTDDVDDLISLSLNSPVRLFVDKSNQLASKLIQEFIRVRNEGDRESIVLALCKKTFHTQCIVFFASKKATHRMKLLFGLNGLNAAELHGDLTQKDRLEALELFRDGKVDYLLCTDVASRGLDIVGIKTVINMHMPAQFKAYLHRVGRTARAGREGRSVSLIGEQERKLLRMAVKNAKDAVRKRVIQPETLTKFRLKIQEQESQVTGILGEERAEKQMNQAEMELTKAENMIKHSDEISSRPARTWFQTPAQKKAAAAEAEKAAKKAAMPKIKRSKTDGMSRTKRRRFLSREEDKVAADKMKGSLRSIKAQAKPKRLAKVDDTPAKAEKKGGSAKKGNVGFTHELTNTSKKSLAGLRSAGKQIPGKQLPGATAGKKSTSASGKKGGDDSKSSSSAKKHEHKMLGKKRAKHQFKSQARYKRR